MGGTGFSLIPGPVLDHVGADVGIVGPGERAACEVVAEISEIDRFSCSIAVAAVCNWSWSWRESCSSRRRAEMSSNVTR